MSMTSTGEALHRRATAILRAPQARGNYHQYAAALNQARDDEAEELADTSPALPAATCAAVRVRVLRLGRELDASSSRRVRP
jgi:hypothetical protein